jgi:hypothetical protein
MTTHSIIIGTHTQTLSVILYAEVVDISINVTFPCLIQTWFLDKYVVNLYHIVQLVNRGATNGGSGGTPPPPTAPLHTERMKVREGRKKKSERDRDLEVEENNFSPL